MALPAPERLWPHWPLPFLNSCEPCHDRHGHQRSGRNSGDGPTGVSEIVYFPIDTALLKAARRTGCTTSDGGNMAVGQAVGAFKLFTGLDPDAARMHAHFRSLVAQRS